MRRSELRARADKGPYPPDRVLHVSKRGWDDNLEKRQGEKWNSYVDYAFSDFLLRREGDGMVRFEDNVEIFPGLRTVYLGGHAICSQAVVIDTMDGPLVIASDDIYLYRLLQDDMQPAIRTSPENYKIAVRRIVDLAQREKGIVLPLHEPLVWEAFESDPSSWIDALRVRSDRAIQGYLASQGE